MYKLDNHIMDYAWGSTTAIAELLGHHPTGRPEAEMWMGAHPKAPSRVVGAEGEGALDGIIARARSSWLGPEALSDGLPFLLKVLAAGEPLSLQAHPNLAQAQAGYERENAAGIPVGAGHRNYRDANHKPELLCALTPFEALCGFRAPEEILALCGPVAALGEVLAPLREQGASGLRSAFERLMSASSDLQRTWVEALCRHAAAHRDGEAQEGKALSWALRLAERYPGDVGVVLSTWLGYLELAPGEAIYLPARVMHAYLHGLGVELMANSDNVLRGGLTPKHVDVPELLSVLDFSVQPVRKVLAEAVSPGVWVYHTPAREFELSRLRVEGELELAATGSPEIYLVVEGALRLQTAQGELELKRGESAAAPASRDTVSLRGSATVYRAGQPLGLRA